MSEPRDSPPGSGTLTRAAELLAADPVVAARAALAERDARTAGLVTLSDEARLLLAARDAAAEEALGAAAPISPYTGRPELLGRYVGEPLASDDFLRRFLGLLDPSLWPVIETLDSFAAYLDPFTSPPDFLAWLASWLDLALDETWTLERQRRLVASAVVLYRWRGTRRGIVEHLAAYLGSAPEVIDETGGVEIADEPPPMPDEVSPLFRVILDVRPDEAELRRLRSIIELAKPAHAGYRIEVRGAAARGARAAAPAADGPAAGASPDAPPGGA